MSSAQPNETEEIPEVRKKECGSVQPLSTPKRTASTSSQTHVIATTNLPESTDSHSHCSSPLSVIALQIPLPEGIKPNYWNDLDLLEDLRKVGLGRLFDQGDIYVDRNGKTVFTGTEIMGESDEHRTLKDSVARSFNQWARKTDNEENLYCKTEAPVDVSNTYKNGEVYADADVMKVSERIPDVAVYSGERQKRGKKAKKWTIQITNVETKETAETEGRKRQKFTKERNCTMNPQLLIQIGVTNPYSTEKDNMDTLMNFAGVQGYICCQRPMVGYYIKLLLHDGTRMENHQVTDADNNEEEGETFGDIYSDVSKCGSYKAYGFLVIKVLPDNRMPDTLDEAMDSTNTNLTQGQVFVVDDEGKFGDDAIISIDMREEVGIDVDDDEHILKISLEELRLELKDDGTVFHAREE